MPSALIFAAATNLGENAGAFVTLLLTVITLSTAAGVGFQRGKIGQLRGELSEERDRRERQGHELIDARAETEQLRTDLDALGRLVTGEAHWVSIGHDLAEHHQESVRRWERMEGILERIASAIEGRQL